MRRSAILVGALMLLVAGAFVTSQAPSWAADALIHPWRSDVGGNVPSGCAESAFDGEGLTLRGWYCRTAAGTPRATVIYLHGIADTRTSAAGVIARLLPRGFDVVAYDSRAHGRSDGSMCTYGFYEKADLRKVIDATGSDRIVLIGMSLGAAVALQEAAGDPRVRAIVAADTFSDLRTVARERAPRIMPAFSVREAFAVAEARGHFRVDDVSPLRAAAHIMAPVLLLHSADDGETRPDHSRRVFDALTGSKRLILVAGARHSQSLRADVWPAIDAWLDEALGTLNHL